MFSHNCEIDMINDLSLSLSFSSKTNKKNQNSIAKLASFSDIHLEMKMNVSTIFGYFSLISEGCFCFQVFLFSFNDSYIQK